MTRASQILAVKNLVFQWPGSKAFGFTISDFSIQAGESVLILGESGSGKSTLLSLICGILAASQGSIHINETNLSLLASAARDRFRAEKIGIIFQQFNLLPYATVKDNIILPLRFASERRKRVPNESAETQRLCAALNLPIDTLKKTAGQLSVGQQQRVAIARALIGRPPLIVADEPTSALDSRSQDAFLSLLFEQCYGSGSALLMVSHDERLHSKFQRVLYFSQLAATNDVTI